MSARPRVAEDKRAPVAESVPAAWLRAITANLAERDAVLARYRARRLTVWQCRQELRRLDVSEQRLRMRRPRYTFENGR